MSIRSRFLRLEAQALWRISPDSPEQHVIAHLGRNSLTLISTDNATLAHWSLSAVQRVRTGGSSAFFSPDPASGEWIEIKDPTMIEALSEILLIPASDSPKRRRRNPFFLAVFAVLLSFGGIIGFSGEFARQLSGLAGKTVREQVGIRIADEFFGLHGAPCDDSNAAVALENLRKRVSGRNAPKVSVVRQGVPSSFLLPGGNMLLANRYVEFAESPEVTAGYILRESISMRKFDPLGQFFFHAGLLPSVRILLDPDAGSESYNSYAAALSDLESPSPPIESLIEGFRKAELPSSPFALSLPPTTDAAAILVALDPFANQSYAPVLRDSDWLTLRDICNNQF